MEVSVSEGLSELKGLGDGSLYESAVREGKGMKIREIARQLSGILSFDYLTNNWGRFEKEEAVYGASNHFADGRFVTLRTDTVFQRRNSTRVKGRFGWISRYSRDMIASIRLLERERLAPILYPDPSPFEEAKFDIFWEQRERLLEQVSTDIDKYGRKDALYFE